MANFNYNHAAIGGRLVNAPELKQTQGGKSVTTFTVAVNRKVNTGDNQIADFLNCIAWGKTAEFISKYFKKEMREKEKEIRFILRGVRE